MPSGTVVLSKRKKGGVVLQMTSAQYDDQKDVTPTGSAAVVALTASSDDQIWELVFDVDTRVLFGTAPVVTAVTGRRLRAGIPYFFGAAAGQTLSIMLAP